ncbi:MAG: NAD(P)H-hydrate dehydratase [Planctomycetota bacterium]|nr:MAG: NAD(P)H-hydrate dehydratase [Planctomycetota bacterium]
MSSIRRITELPALPLRLADSHKGTYGRVLLIGGSAGMSGAAALSGLGALRGGAGLVYVATPCSVASIVAAIEPSYLTIPLPEDERGRIALEALETLQPHWLAADCVAVGPGLGQSDELRLLLAQILQTTVSPCVLDADALNLLVGHEDWLAGAGPRLLTPHPGEFARLTGRTIAEVQSRREELALAFARKNQVTLVLKGAGTVITDGERVHINTTGNAGMATGGTGDVLTGLLAALCAQQMPAFEAACLACHLHGLAGDLAAEEWSQPGMMASDLPRYLGRAWQQVWHPSQ